MSTQQPKVSLNEDTIDDLLYSARVGDELALEADLTTLASQHDTTPAQLLSNAVDETTGNSVVHYACANGHQEVISYILTTMTTSSQDNIIAPLLSRQNTSGNTPLHYAAMNGHLQIVKSILDALKSSTSKEDHSSYLTTKNNAGRDAAFEAETAGKEDVVTYLLGAMDDADVELGVSVGNTDAGEGSSMDVDEEPSNLEEVANGVKSMDVSEDAQR